MGSKRGEVLPTVPLKVKSSRDPVRTKKERSCGGSGQSCAESDRTHAESELCEVLQQLSANTSTGCTNVKNCWTRAAKSCRLYMSYVKHLVASCTPSQTCRATGQGSRAQKSNRSYAGSELCEVFRQRSANTSTGCANVKTAGLQPRSPANCTVETSRAHRVRTVMRRAKSVVH